MSWLARVKRRRPGVYAYRTRRHYAPLRKEWGYVGKSRDLVMRDRCHAGACGRHKTCVQKPWYDLVAYRITIQLPWWLGWDWLTLSLETGLIWLLRPRYNIAKNPWPHLNRMRQTLERMERETAPPGYRAMVAMGPWITWATRIIALALIAAGVGGYLWTR